jgi:N-acetylglucosaminyl-diphospho-decaprenol L-rhamnosyltransferase
MSALGTGVELPDVDVVIVAHDSGPLLERAVASIEGQVAVGRVVVIDAESSDGSVQTMSAAHPSVRVIHAANRGFAASNNVGIVATSGHDVLLLNPDAELEEHGLRTLVSRMRSNRTAGIVAPQIINEDGTLQDGSFGQFPTFARTLITRLNAVVHRVSGGKFKPRAEITQTLPVDWVTGACMLVRRSAIEKVGPMDEGFFLYYEDVEWCHRMHDGCYTVLIEPSACCTHLRGGSGGDSPAVQQNYRDSFYRYCKLYHLSGLAAAARLGLVARRAVGGRP